MIDCIIIVPCFALAVLTAVLMLCRYGQLPPIQKMDNTLGTLKACKHLSISSNAIDRIAGLKGMDSLKTLYEGAYRLRTANAPSPSQLPPSTDNRPRLSSFRSLGRNQIKAFTGLEDILDTLEELWVSYVGSICSPASEFFLKS